METEFASESLSQLKLEIHPRLQYKACRGRSPSSFKYLAGVIFSKPRNTPFLHPARRMDRLGFTAAHLRACGYQTRNGRPHRTCFAPNNAGFLKLLGNSEKRGAEKEARKAYTALGRFRDTLFSMNKCTGQRKR